MTTNTHPAAVARSLTGAGTAIALIGMVTGFQISAAHAEQQAAAAAVVDAAPASVPARALAVRVLDASLLPEPVAAPAAPSSTSSGSTSSRSGGGTAAPAPAAPARPAPAPAPAAPAPAPAPPADGTTAGSGG